MEKQPLQIESHLDLDCRREANVVRILAHRAEEEGRGSSESVQESHQLDQGKGLAHSASAFSHIPSIHAYIPLSCFSVSIQEGIAFKIIIVHSQLKLIFIQQ